METVMNLKLILLFVLFITSCVVRTKPYTTSKTNEGYSKNALESFNKACNSNTLTESQKNTLNILKAIVEKDCNNAFEPLNNMSVMDFGIPEKGDEKILDLDILRNFVHLTHLTIRHHKLLDPKQLGVLKSLTRLILNFNEFQDVSALSSLTALTFLDLSQNTIKSLDSIQSLKALTDLWIRNNKITDISPLKDVPELRYLDLSHNQITDLSALRGAAHLLWFFVEDNPLTDISPLYGLTTLNAIQFDTAKVKDVPDTFLSKRLSI
jgi:Leucine-rich repeat (LRR) protein